MTTKELERAAEFIRTSVATEGASDPLGHIRFTEALTRHTERRARNRRIVVAGAACTLAMGTFFTFAAMQPQMLTYRTDDSSDVGTLGSYMSAPTQAPLGLRFSEGSRVVLQPRARGRVSQTSRNGATMVLEDGRAHAEIVHRDRTDWRVLAGPFVVGVTGTTFDVAFDVATQTFELKMQSGTVRVTGPGLKEPLVARDGQRLVLSAKGTDAPTVRPDATPNSWAASDPTEMAPVPATSAASLCSASATAPMASAPEMAPQRRDPVLETVAESFSQLGARGKHQRIVELAEMHGFDSTISAANRTDLLALGNAARFVGRTNLAAMAYHAVRERFSKSSEATAAAFFLGRLSESSNPAQAITWYELYVTEAPHGVWVADALGRRMAKLNETQAGPNAQTAAQEYLDRFPSGPYAGFARKILAP